MSGAAQPSPLDGGSRSPADLSDAELEEELRQRRRRRAGRSSTAGRDEETSHALQDRDLAQCFANLELKPGASLAEVEQAYQELKKKYHPDQHRDDPERHKVATELTRELTRAYLTLSTLLDVQTETR